MHAPFEEPGSAGIRALLHSVTSSCHVDSVQRQQHVRRRPVAEAGAAHRSCARLLVVKPSSPGAR